MKSKCKMQKKNKEYCKRCIQQDENNENENEMKL